MDANGAGPGSQCQVLNIQYRLGIIVQECPAPVAGNLQFQGDPLTGPQIGGCGLSRSVEQLPAGHVPICGRILHHVFKCSAMMGSQINDLIRTGCVTAEHDTRVGSGAGAGDIHLDGPVRECHVLQVGTSHKGIPIQVLDHLGPAQFPVGFVKWNSGVRGKAHNRYPGQNNEQNGGMFTEHCFSPRFAFRLIR